MKKVVALLLMLTILFATALPSFADGAEISVTYPQKASVGDRIQVAVFFNTGTGVAAVSIAVKFDTSVLEYAGCRSGDVGKSFMINSTNADISDASNIKITLMNLSNVVKNGTLVILSFNVLEQYAKAPISLIEVSGEGKSVVDIDGVPVGTAITIKSLSTEEYLEQTISENGSVNAAADKIQSAQQIISDPASTDEQKQQAANEIVNSASVADTASDTNTDIVNTPSGDNNGDDNTENKTDGTTVVDNTAKKWIIIGACVIIVAAIAVIIIIVAGQKKKNKENK